MSDEQIDVPEVEQSEEIPEGYTLIADADDEALEAFLARGRDEPAPDDRDAPPAPGETDQPVKAEEAPKQEQPAAKPDEQAASKEEIEKLQAQVERQRAQLEQQELYIQRQKSRLGDAKKQLREAIQTKQQGLDERAVENPAQAMKDLREIEKAEDHIKQLDDEEHRLIAAHESFKLVSQYVKEEDIDLEAMATSLTDDGIPADQVAEFKKQPLVWMAPVTLVQLAKRAKAEKYLGQLLEYTKGLQEEVKTLKAKPERLLNGVQRELKKGPPVTAAKGNSSARDRTPNTSPATMSDKQIEEFLANTK